MSSASSVRRVALTNLSSCDNEVALTIGAVMLRTRDQPASETCAAETP